MLKIILVSICLLWTQTAMSATALTVAFIGHQTTRGDGPLVEGGWRPRYLEGLSVLGFAVDAIGSQCDGVSFDCNWEGGTFFGAQDLAPLAGTLFTDNTIDLAVIDVGMVDVYIEHDTPAQVVTQIVAGIEAIHTASPLTKLLVMQPLDIFRSADAKALHDGLGIAMSTREYVFLVDVYSTLAAPDDFIATFLPTTAGYGKIADVLTASTVNALSGTQVPIPGALWLLTSGLCFMLMRTRQHTT